MFLLLLQIGNTYYSKADVSIECFDDFYYQNIFPLNVVVIVLVGLVIPCVLMYFLKKKRKLDNTESYNFQRSYGILFLDLRKPCILWEGFTMIVVITLF